MGEINETGHAKNVANLSKLTTTCEELGDKYQPAMPYISIPELKTMHTTATEGINNVYDRFAEFLLAVDKRRDIYAPLSKTSTRVLNLLYACDADKDIINNASQIVKDIQGSKTGNRKDVNPDSVTENKISVSQMSYDMRADNTNKLIRLLKNVSAYSPNETDLQITALESLHSDMLASTDKVNKAYARLEDARKKRDEILYSNEYSLINRVKDAKRYVKAVFGSDSGEFRSVSEIKFKTQICKN